MIKLNWLGHMALVNYQVPPKSVLFESNSYGEAERWMRAESRNRAERRINRLAIAAAFILVALAISEAFR